MLVITGLYSDCLPTKKNIGFFPLDSRKLFSYIVLTVEKKVVNPIMVEFLMLYVTRKMYFSASHRLHSDQLSDKENIKAFGICNNPSGHGHNYEVHVTVRGEPDPITGMVIDLMKLKEIIQKELIIKVDHKHLNHDVEFFRNVVPTAENMCIAFWNILKDKLPRGELHEIKVFETENNYAYYRGE